MENNVLLSIITVNYNSFYVLQKCIRSIHKSDFLKSRYEIIIIDNCSKDKNSIKRLKNGKRLKIIINQKNVGFAKANNIGIKKSIGKYVLLLNPDTIISKDVLSKLFKYMEDNIDVGIVTSKVNLTSGVLDDACHRGFPTPWNAFCQFSGLSKLFPYNSLFNGYHLGYKNMDRIHEIDSCSGAFMFVRRRVGEELFWLDEDYFWYGEDIDFCYRVKKSGKKIIYYPFVEIQHIKGYSSGIKKHSKHLSTAKADIIKNSTRFRFEVMKVFYDKHFKKKYPVWVTKFVFIGIKLIKQIHSITTGFIY